MANMVLHPFFQANLFSWDGGEIGDEKQSRKESPAARGYGLSGLELTAVAHTYDKPGCCIVAVKVIDNLGNVTMTVLLITVGREVI